MCSIFASSGSHGIANLHVCVDLIFSPSGRLTTKGLVAGDISVTGVPGSTKCPVAPASVIVMLTEIFIFNVLNIVSAWRDCDRLCFWIVCFQILFPDASGIVVVGMGGALLSTDESYVSIYVSEVLSST